MNASTPVTCTFDTESATTSEIGWTMTTDDVSPGDMDPTNDPEVTGHEKGQKPPFPPMYAGDPLAGHHRSCAFRLGHDEPCTCGVWELEAPGPPESPSFRPVGRIAQLPLASDFIHSLLHLPEDVHIVDVTWENIHDADLGNVVLTLEAFSDNEFPSQRVTARFHEKFDVTTGKMTTMFDGWESIDQLGS